MVDSNPADSADAERSTQPLHVLMVASEAQPFSKTGGLADVSTALAQALGRQGHRVTLFTPRYRGVPAGPARERLRVFVADRWVDAALHPVALGEHAEAMLVDCPPLFDRDGIYATDGADYPDNALRFALLSIAAVQWNRGQPALASVLHAHDWQAGLLPVYERRLPCVLTVHNLAFQGLFPNAWVPQLGLRWEDFTAAGFEYYDRLSFLKAGLVFSDALTTVSPTYAEEIQRRDYGHGFDGIIRSRARDLVGILNGIDDHVWNPARDPLLPASFDAGNLSGKRVAKRALLERFGLPSDDAALERPLIAMVSRMTAQKGLDLVAALTAQLPTLNASFVIVGTGEPQYEGMWRGLAAAYPQQFGVFIGFDEARAHLVEAGADVFLMPSRYEPCGLNQMYSMRYGTVPVVRGVGGLVDTVRPFGVSPGGDQVATGFVFSDYHPGALWATLLQALRVRRTDGEAWQRMQGNGMRTDFSWDRSAAQYVTVYNRIIAARAKS